MRYFQYSESSAIYTEKGGGVKKNLSGRDINILFPVFVYIWKTMVYNQIQQMMFTAFLISKNEY